MRNKVNYIWVGKPRSLTVDEPQQDLVGPMKMHLTIDHHTTSIHFWCLEKYTEHYGLLLKNTPIIVSPIESFLHEQLDHTDMLESAEKVIVLVNRVIQDNFQIRACVTAKESFAFFLMAAEGGYVLDTNVLPASDCIEFPEHANFSMPAYHQPVLSRDNDDDTDVGIMFSPPMNRVHAHRALNFFLERIGELDKNILLREGYSENYKTALIHVVIQAALVCDSNQNQSEVAFWKAKRLGPGFPVLLDEQPRVVKYYANSHGAERGHRSPLHDAAARGDLAEVTRLLETGCSYDETIPTMDYETITPLFAAEFYGHKAVADQLRQQENTKLIPPNNSNENHADVRLFTPKNETSRPTQTTCPFQCNFM